MPYRHKQFTASHSGKENNSLSFSRSRDGHILHVLICKYCFEANTPQEAEKGLKAICEFLDKRIEHNPQALFQISTNGYSHIADALNMPFAKDIRCDKELRIKKAADLLDCLIGYCHKAANGAGAGFDDFAAVMTYCTDDGLTPLHLALSHGHKALYDRIKTELAHLHKYRLIDDRTYRQQFTLALKDNVTPLHTVVRTGNAVLCQAFIQDIQNILPQDLYRRELLQRTHNRWNVFHTATQPLESKGLPNPFIIDMLHGAFYDGFGKQAKEMIARLNTEVNQQGYPAFHSQQPVWLQRLLRLSDTEPLSPGYSRRIS